VYFSFCQLNKKYTLQIDYLEDMYVLFKAGETRPVKAGVFALCQQTLWLLCAQANSTHPFRRIAGATQRPASLGDNVGGLACLRPAANL
jgi:hypothetical protein